MINFGSFKDAVEAAEIQLACSSILEIRLNKIVMESKILKVATVSVRRERRIIYGRNSGNDGRKEEHSQNEDIMSKQI